MEIVEIWQNLEKKRNTDYDFPPHSQINLWGRKIIINLYFSILLYGANGGDRVGQKQKKLDHQPQK